MTKRVFNLTGGAIPLFAWRLPQEIAAYKQTKMPANQWIPVIKGFSQKGIKGVEIEDAKVIPWLEERGKDTVTREELAEFVTYSLPAIKEARFSGGDVKYRNYSWADGTQDYNESLFYFPTITEDFSDRIADLDDAISALNFDLDKLAEDPDIVTRLDTKRNDLFRRQKDIANGDASPPATHFASNLKAICPDARADFAHLRWSVFNFDGVRTLFVHEFQSDWAQRGRAEAANIQKTEMYQALRRRENEMSEEERTVLSQYYWCPSDAAAGVDVEKERDDLYIKYVGSLPGAPEWKGQYKKAPLVSETEYWTTFLMRRAMSIAVEMDCKQLTWINGSSMANGARARGAKGLDEFYMKIVTGIAKRLAKPFSAELALADFTLRGDPHRLAVMPVTKEMKEKFAPRVPVYSYAKLVQAATFDPVKAERLRRALQGRADKMFGKEQLMRVKVVGEILDAYEHSRPAGALIGHVAEIAFNAEDPVKALNHEAFHFAHEYLFTSREKDVIRRQFAPGSPLLARTIRILMARNEVDAARQAANSPEEAAAHAFSLWKRGQMSVSKISALATNTENRRGMIDVVTRIFPAAEQFVTTICEWIRGSSVSPSDFVAKIVRVHEDVTTPADIDTPTLLPTPAEEGNGLTLLSLQRTRNDNSAINSSDTDQGCDLHANGGAGGMDQPLCEQPVVAR